MVQVTMGNNIKRATDVVDENRTLRSVLEENDINYTSGVTTLDGCPLHAGDLDKTFAEHGIREKCYLLCVTKADNAR